MTKRLQTGAWSHTYAGKESDTYNAASYTADADREIGVNLLAYPTGAFAGAGAVFEMFVTLVRSGYNESWKGGSYPSINGSYSSNGIEDFHGDLNSYYLTAGNESNPAWSLTEKRIFVHTGDIINVYIAQNTDDFLTAAGFVEFYGTETPAELLEGIVEGALTLKAVLRLILAVLSGKASGGGTTSIKFRDVTDGMDRVSMTVDASGNRSAVTLDGSDVP
jgi:hypothetical protein